MRIRKQISPWSSKMFISLTVIVFITYGGLMLLAKTLDGEPLTFSYSLVFSCILQPLIFASIFTNASRKMTLFVNDFHNIESFANKLNESILNKGVAERNSANNVATYAATGWFYKLFNNWDGSETIFVKWGDEVMIQGSSRIVSQIEDSLTWNAAFK
jgi:hypothetical protein